MDFLLLPGAGGAGAGAAGAGAAVENKIGINQNYLSKISFTIKHCIELRIERVPISKVRLRRADFMSKN